MKNILFVESGQGIGGSVISLYNLINGLDKNRYSPFCIFYDEHFYTKELRKAGATVVVLKPKKSNPNLFIKRLTRNIFLIKEPRKSKPYLFLSYIKNLLIFTLPTAFRISRLLKKFNIDIVHCNIGLRYNHEGIIAARLAGVPCICHVRTIGKLNVADRLISKCVHLFVCVSEAVKKNYESFNVNPNKLCIVYNGVDLQVFNPALSGRKIKEEFDIKNNVVGIIGRLIAWKGHECFLRAVKEVISDFGNVKFLIVGTGPEKSSLETYSMDLGLKDSVIFVGFREDMPQILAAIDILVNCSIQPEPLSRAIMEAMAMEKAVIASNCGGSPDMIEDGVNGLLVPPRDSKVLAQCIITLLKDKELRLRLGKAARKKVEERFDKKMTQKKIERIYEEIFLRYA